MKQRPRPWVRTRRPFVLPLALMAWLWLLGAPAPAAADTAALSVTVTGVDVAQPGQTVSLRVMARNDGPAEAAGVVLSGELAPSTDTGEVDSFWTCAAADPAPAGTPGPQPELGIDDLATTLTLPAGGVVSCQVSVQTLRTFVGELRYTARLTAPGTVTDPDPSDNEAVARTQVPATADLQLAVRGLPSAPISGQVVSFVVSVRNVGPSTARGLRLDIDKPAGALLDPPTGQAPTGPGWSCEDRGTTFRCTLPELPIFEVSELLLALLPGAEAARVTVGARIAADTIEPVPADNVALAELPIEWREGKARIPVLTGGGFGCSLSGSRSRPGTGPISTSITLALVGCVFFRRRRIQPSPTRGLPCDESC